jgi:hypothetical protein
MIEINCSGGRIGRFRWENSCYSGLFSCSGQFRTSLLPGRCHWDETWPDCHAWPVRPWGIGDPAAGHWRGFASFENWLSAQLEARNLDGHDFSINERIEMYAMMVDVFQAGVDAGRNPWRCAQQLSKATTTPQEAQ